MIDRNLLDNLPARFTLAEARAGLEWPADDLSLRQFLLHEGFIHRYVRLQGAPFTQRVFVRPDVASPATSEDHDTWECGSDQQIAKLALLLIDRNRIADVAAFNWLEGSITAAGPRFCRQMTERLDGSNEVPF